MLALSLTVIVYEPAFSVVTFLPPFASVIVKPGPTVPARGVAADGERGGSEREARDGERGGGDERVTWHDISCEDGAYAL